MPSLRLKYMVEDYLDLKEDKNWDMPNLKLKYLVPDYRQLKEYNPKQMSFNMDGKNTAA